MLHIALKEWAVVCDLLVEGRLAILLRKGGIHEDTGPGRFRLEYDRFALFPAWEHQDPGRIKPAWRGRVEVFDAEPSELTIKGYAFAERIWEVPSRAAFDRLDDLHCWTGPQIDMRFGYKPDRPLYLLALRTYRLERERTIVNTPRYAGCKSWVDLDPRDHINEMFGVAAMDDAAFTSLVTRVDEALL
jgi:hypothetical protein